LEPKVAQPISAEYYKQSILSFDKDTIHPIDQMNFHKQSGEMLYKTITNTDMAVAKLKVSLTNSQAQLKLEIVSSQAKDGKIKSLEDLIIKLGYGPNDVKATI